MGFIHFPTQLTEEEQALKSKYAKLKRKRKQLKPQPSKEQEQKEQADKILASIAANKRKSQEGIAKPDTKELAKKLLKSGAIKPIKSEPAEKTVFKRSKGAGRKRNIIGSEVGYQPFSEPGSKGGDSRGPNSKVGALDQDDPALLAEKEFNPDAPAATPSAPRKGNTVYLHAQGMTETLARKACASHGGSIAHISVEENKSCAFVTFENYEAAEKVIQALDGNFVLGLTFKAALARRQPQLPSNAAPPPPIPSSNSSENSRSLVVYDSLPF
ncbi:negative elongation factor E-like [Varroa jacobsoni]|uniref:Negative elongation factor E n=1 Tax=Varroa destructor TaxID=109461 RepID=A0A7M7K6W3_VARDE|nr:negative elongation factor E-like [Varroa destructor]XP_022708741.1 negative elongation factor E-like [Varroa jacobsoni]